MVTVCLAVLSVGRLPEVTEPGSDPNDFGNEMTGKMRTRRIHSGVTLLELMVAVAVAGVLLAIGIPSFRYFILDSRRISLGNELLASMMMARSESIKQGRTVIVCGYAEDSSGQPTCLGSGGNWNVGWIVQEPTLYPPSNKPNPPSRVVKNDGGSNSVASSQVKTGFGQFSGSCQAGLGIDPTIPLTSASISCVGSITTTICDTQKSSYNGSQICRGSKVVVQSSGVATLRSTDADSPNPCAC